jgi:hypothetical protein
MLIFNFNKGSFMSYYKKTLLAVAFCGTLGLHSADAVPFASLTNVQKALVKRMVNATSFVIRELNLRIEAATSLAQQCTPNYRNNSKICIPKLDDLFGTSADSGNLSAYWLGEDVVGVKPAILELNKNKDIGLKDEKTEFINKFVNTIEESITSVNFDNKIKVKMFTTQFNEKNAQFFMDFSIAVKKQVTKIESLINLSNTDQDWTNFLFGDQENNKIEEKEIEKSEDDNNKNNKIEKDEDKTEEGVKPTREELRKLHLRHFEKQKTTDKKQDEVVVKNEGIEDESGEQISDDGKSITSESNDSQLKNGTLEEIIENFDKILNKYQEEDISDSKSVTNNNNKDTKMSINKENPRIEIKENLEDGSDINATSEDETDEDFNIIDDEEKILIDDEKQEVKDRLLEKLDLLCTDFPKDLLNIEADDADFDKEEEIVIKNKEQERIDRLLEKLDLLCTDFPKDLLNIEADDDADFDGGKSHNKDKKIFLNESFHEKQEIEFHLNQRKQNKIKEIAKQKLEELKEMRKQLKQVQEDVIDMQDKIDLHRKTLGVNHKETSWEIAKFCKQNNFLQRMQNDQKQLIELADCTNIKVEEIYEWLQVVQLDLLKDSLFKGEIMLEQAKTAITNSYDRAAKAQNQSDKLQNDLLKYAHVLIATIVNNYHNGEAVQLAVQSFILCIIEQNTSCEPGFEGRMFTSILQALIHLVDLRLQELLKEETHILNVLDNTESGENLLENKNNFKEVIEIAPKQKFNSNEKISKDFNNEIDFSNENVEEQEAIYRSIMQTNKQSSKKSDDGLNNPNSQSMLVFHDHFNDDNGMNNSTTSNNNNSNMIINGVQQWTPQLYLPNAYRDVAEWVIKSSPAERKFNGCEDCEESINAVNGMTKKEAEENGVFLIWKLLHP